MPCLRASAENVQEHEQYDLMKAPLQVPALTAGDVKSQLDSTKHGVAEPASELVQVASFWLSVLYFGLVIQPRSFLLIEYVRMSACVTGLLGHDPSCAYVSQRTRVGNNIMIASASSMCA